MSDSFDPACIAPVASFSAMITSLFFCFESDVWSCKTSAKLGSIASVSIVAFFAANALTRKLKFEGTKLHAVNSMVIVLPQILMSLAESAHTGSTLAFTHWQLIKLRLPRHVGFALSLPVLRVPRHFSSPCTLR
eukprot:TRINITY_DN12234_c0_g1_i1.p1 TRINITY_DN12234_c0_g1~~TRINITY_DN12234_c0_g1_i1.p1  ORF type:complete len:144 (-),score=4.36 TRINITY_DN12234_c0_g1_i1:5-406(-)